MPDAGEVDAEADDEGDEGEADEAAAVAKPENGADAADE